MQLAQARAASPLSAKVSAGQSAQCVAVSLKVPACGGCGGGVSATTTHPTRVCNSSLALVNSPDSSRGALTPHIVHEFRVKGVGFGVLGVES